MGDNRMPAAEVICAKPGPSKTWKNFDYLKSEAQRLDTFIGWPQQFIQPRDLAKAGFFYLKDKDLVQCIFCRGIVGDWEEGDEPLTEHAKHFPYCPLVRNLNVGNIPEGNPPEIAQVNGYDVAGHHNIALNSRPEQNHSASNLPEKWKECGILPHNSPKHPSFANENSRLHSFSTWPQGPLPRPEDLAAAGFFYVDVSDHVKCFHCDGGLSNWEPEDDPWVEHARWLSNCSFLELKKGRPFVEQYSQHTTGEGGSTTLNGFSHSEPSLTNNHHAAQPNHEVASSATKFAKPPVEKINGIAKNDPIIVSPPKEQESTNDYRLCKICLDNEIEVVFLPCGHLVSCTNCSSAITTCPLCRKEIIGTVRTYLS